jgi:hypothetical protein
MSRAQEYTVLKLTSHLPTQSARFDVRLFGMLARIVSAQPSVVRREPRSSQYDITIACSERQARATDRDRRFTGETAQQLMSHTRLQYILTGAETEMKWRSALQAGAAQFWDASRTCILRIQGLVGIFMRLPLIMRQVGGM